MDALRILRTQDSTPAGTTVRILMSGALALVTAVDGACRVHTEMPAANDASVAGTYIPRDESRLFVLEPSGDLWVYAGVGVTVNCVTCEVYRPESVR